MSNRMMTKRNISDSEVPGRGPLAARTSGLLIVVAFLICTSSAPWTGRAGAAPQTETTQDVAPQDGTVQDGTVQDGTPQTEEDRAKRRQGNRRRNAGAGTEEGVTQYDPKVRVVLEQAEKALYSPFREIETLTFRITSPMLEQMMPGVTLHCGWTAPDQPTFELKGPLPDPASKQATQSRLKSTVGGVAGSILQKPLIEEFRGCDIEMALEGGLTRLTITPAAGSGAQWLSQTMWLEQYLPKQVESVVEHPKLGRTTETTRFFYKKIGDRVVVDHLLQETPLSSLKVSWSYTEIKGLTLLQKMTIESEMSSMGPMTIEFLDIQVNASTEG